MVAYCRYGGQLSDVKHVCVQGILITGFLGTFRLYFVQDNIF